jgi:hypothetical protein
MTELEFTDINDDGKLDIISVGDHGCPFINSSEHGIMVWFGDGLGSWSVQMTGNFGYGGIAVGDVNNDGFNDVGYGIHHNYSSTDLGDQILEVALGNGTGVNWNPWDDGLATNGEDWGMFACDFADVDHDGDLDLGSISFGCCAGVHVYLNNLDGSWTQGFGFIGGNSNMRFVFGDINNDGHADFITAHQNGAVYFGDGQGNFTNATGNLPSPGLVGYSGPSLGDIDNNGSKDIAFSKNGGVQVWCFDTTQSLWINKSGLLPASGQFQETQLWDMNVDGYMDICAYGNGIFKLWLGDGQGNWTADVQFTTTGIADCSAFRVGGDIDHNGFPDIILVAEGGSFPNYQNHLRCYKEASSAGNLNIHGIFPHRHEVFYQQSVQFIDWITAVPGGTGSSTDLFYSVTGPNGPYVEIGTGLTDNGRYQWTVPMAYSNNCYMRFVVHMQGGVTSCDTTGPFTITGIPVLFPMFEAAPTAGPVPLTVQFTDLSTGNVMLYEWDFQNDGVYDFFIQNPEFTYNEPGIYSVKLRISDGISTDSLVREDYIEAIFTGTGNLFMHPDRNKPISILPNPFNDEAVIYLNVPPETIISLKLFNLNGSEISDLTDRINRLTNECRIIWNGTGQNGNKLKPGIYLLQLITGHSMHAIKVIIFSPHTGSS